MLLTDIVFSGNHETSFRQHAERIAALLLLLLIVVYLMYQFSRVVLFSMALIYMFSGIWARAAYSWSRRRRWRRAGPRAGTVAAVEPEPPSGS